MRANEQIWSSKPLIQTEHGIGEGLWVNDLIDYFAGFGLNIFQLDQFIQNFYPGFYYLIVLFGMVKTLGGVSEDIIESEFEAYLSQIK